MRLCGDRAEARFVKLVVFQVYITRGYLLLLETCTSSRFGYQMLPRREERRQYLDARQSRHRILLCGMASDKVDTDELLRQIAEQRSEPTKQRQTRPALRQSDADSANAYIAASQRYQRMHQSGPATAMSRSLRSILRGRRDLCSPSEILWAASLPFS